MPPQSTTGGVGPDLDVWVMTLCDRDGVMGGIRSWEAAIYGGGEGVRVRHCAAAVPLISRNRWCSMRAART